MKKRNKDERQILSMTIRGSMTPAMIAAPMVMVAGGALADYLPITGEYIINGNANDQATPGFGGHDAVAMDADGNFVAVWNQYYGQDNRGGGGYATARVFNADGTPRTGNLMVSAGGETRGNSAVAMDDDGDFVVVWTEYNYVGSRGNGLSYGIFAQRFNATGSPQGSAITVVPDAAANPTVAMDSDGDFVVAWQQLEYYDRGGNFYSYVVAQRFNASGMPQGGTIDVSSNQGILPSVAMDEDGDFAVAWSSGYGGGFRGGYGYVYGRTFNSGGTPTSGPFVASDSSSAFDGVIAMDSDGDFGIAWAVGYGAPVRNFDPESRANRGGDDPAIRARLFTPTGAPKGPSIMVNTNTDMNARSRTSISMDGDGDFAVAWASYAQDGQDDYDIYVRLFDATGNPDPERPAETLVNQTTEGDQEDPSVSMDADGDFVVVWRANDGDPYAIIGGNANDSDVGGRLFSRVAGRPAVIPTLSGIGMTVLGGALAGLGVWQTRRRRKKAE